MTPRDQSTPTLKDGYKKKLIAILEDLAIELPNGFMHQEILFQCKPIFKDNPLKISSQWSYPNLPSYLANFQHQSSKDEVLIIDLSCLFKYIFILLKAVYQHC